jgi:hypothetical protein
MPWADTLCGCIFGVWQCLKCSIFTASVGIGWFYAFFVECLKWKLEY